jgi:uncharacterized damage-inducible protein DinB
MERTDAVHANPIDKNPLDKYVPRILKCLQLLDEKEIWWRPNVASNTVGNLVLHLCGNIRQWIISGLGGKPDVRKRDEEFAKRRRVSRRMLIATLKQTAEEARHTLDRMSPATLDQEFAIQGYRVFGRTAVSIVYEHLAYHAGQIIYVTKFKRGKDLGFTHLQPEPKHAETEAPSPSRKRSPPRS